MSDAEGNYEMPGLKAGTYQVTASMSGFKTSVFDDVRLQSSQVKRVDVVLEVGEVTTEVNVSAAATAIQTEQATIGADFNAAKRYGDLPVPGNAFSGTYAVLAILPDVQREPGVRVDPQVRHLPDRRAVVPDQPAAVPLEHPPAQRTQVIDYQLFTERPDLGAGP